MNDNETSLSAVFGRVFWMMFGPLTLVLLAFTIIQIGSGWATWADVAFLAVLALMMLARWLEFRHGHPQTVTGEPATQSHLRHYLQAAIPLGLTVWVAANVVGNHVLNR